MTKEKTETNQEQEVDLVREAFNGAIQFEGFEEDTVKLAMITAGASFKNVARLFNQYMIDAGLALSKEDRDEKIVEAIGDFDLALEVGFADAVGALLGEVDGMTERSGSALIRAYAKKNEIECYAKPKSEGTGRITFASEFYDFLVTKPLMEKDEAKAYVMGEGEHTDTSENVQKNLHHYLNVWELANRVAKSLQV